MGIDKATFWIFIGFWPIYIVWELILLYMRSVHPSVDLISMVARDRSYQLTAMAFAWGSLAAHFWMNWREVPMDSPVLGVLFFGLIAAVLASDLLLWKTAYESLPLWARVVRFPGTMLLLGLLNGFLLFPQKAPSASPF